MYNLIESNNKIIELIELNKPFYITRLGDLESVLSKIKYKCTKNK